MPLILGLLLLAIFAGATVCLMLANFYFIQVYEETNRLLPEGGKIPLWKVQWSAFTISREHRRLFPRSSKRRAMYVFTTVGVALFCSFVVIVILMNLGKPKHLTVKWDKGEEQNLSIPFGRAVVQASVLGEILQQDTNQETGFVQQSTKRDVKDARQGYSHLHL